MKNAGRPRADADGGWKDIIEDFTEEFLRFYFPEVHAAIGSSRRLKRLHRLAITAKTLDAFEL